ncbi:MAG: hypothetical protein AVDCRST_MAG09-1007 [uncultured Sphingomonas sp.]|uniref:Uncharacterized protein n=1 Tax=uncultured Sphingomonas sp. TaxID=158754 RepID=A0A6J4SQ98_9SPHN|nr:hypothetical protein [uncultured Sphingomonas sp.]CAA9501011.1 MAG: hypothetical protein AVDCRST_MAG09-1007 [uncultured Sphingomonas sp.]
MAKKTKKAKKHDEKLALIAGPDGGGAQSEGAGKDKKAKKAKADGRGSGLESLARLADHPLVGDLIAVGALAAVAAIAESGKDDTAKVKSANAVKAAGKAAAAAIGARLLKEVSGSGGAKKPNGV